MCLDRNTDGNKDVRILEFDYLSYVTFRETNFINFFFLKIYIFIFLFISDTKVYERHLHLKATIGTLQMEDEAFVLCYYLSWVFYPIFTLIGILQMILFLLYNQKFHPFSVLLIRPDADDGK